MKNKHLTIQENNPLVVEIQTLQFEINIRSEKINKEFDEILNFVERMDLSALELNVLRGRLDRIADFLEGAKDVVNEMKYLSL